MNPLLHLRTAQREAERCLQCHDAPCTEACPAHIDVPAFIRSILSGNVTGAAEVVRSANALASVCGAVCPQEIFCQDVCTRAQQDRPVEIRDLHGFATGWQSEHGPLRPHVSSGPGGQVGVVGAGPAGLACAFTLALFGHRVTVYDRQIPGGVPRASIPSFRLRDADLNEDLSFLSPHFVFKGEELDAAGLRRIKNEHDAVFIAAGLGADRPLPISGASLPGVLPVLRFLESAKLHMDMPPPGDRMIIVGGGNVSLDAAATAKRLGASDVTLMYRRSEQEMRIWKSELEEARRQGVQMAFLTRPVEILGTARVEGVRCRRTRLSDRCDPDGRRIPEDILHSEFMIDADAIIVAIGQIPTAEFLPLFERTSRGYVKVDLDYQTSIPSVFAGGDIIGGEGTIVQSVAQGKAAAGAIHRYISSGNPGGRP
jgi:dihydropyrimidine dehydrogenase (NAD+) subunit PreT